MGDDVLETVDRMDELLDGLMLLVQAGRPLPRREPVDLAAVAGAAAARACGARSVALRLDLAPATVRGEQRLLERLAENLLENGVRYNAPGGFVVRPHGRARRHGAAARRQQRAARSRPRPPSGCSSRSSAAAARATTAARGSASRSSARSPRRTAGASRSAPRPEGGLAVDVVLPRG